MSRTPLGARDYDYGYLGDVKTGLPNRHRAPKRTSLEPRRRDIERADTIRVQRTGVPPSTRAVQSKAHSKAAFYAFVALAMVLMFVQITRIAAISGNMKLISNISNGIREAQNEKGNLSVRLSMQQNITRVRDEAVNRLSMVEPDTYQIKVVSLNVGSVDSQMRTASTSVQTME